MKIASVVILSETQRTIRIEDLRIFPFKLHHEYCVEIYIHKFSTHCKYQKFRLRKSILDDENNNN